MKFLVLKREDIAEYVTEKSQEKLEDICDCIEIMRKQEGKNSCNKYLVINVDEPYAGVVADTIENAELRKGTWEHGDKHLRELMGIPKYKCLGKSTCGGCDSDCPAY